MADETLMRLIEQGSGAWNAWRDANPDAVIDLRNAALEKADLRKMNLGHADLRSADLSFSNLSEANLAFADLEKAELTFAGLQGANLSAANLTNASLEDAQLDGAILSNACLKNAVMSSASLKNARLHSASLEGANLAAANLENANCTDVFFDRSVFQQILRRHWMQPGQLYSRRYDLLLDTTIRCRGVNAAGIYGSPRFRLFLLDQDFLEECMAGRKGRLLCYLWWVFADCGRSIIRWAAWSLVLAVLFALLFYCLGERSFYVEHLDFNLFTALYYSIVTFSTLGFGDIVPKTATASLLVVLEVLTGYVMLGGLISIFSNKLARRGG